MLIRFYLSTTSLLFMRQGWFLIVASSFFFSSTCSFRASISPSDSEPSSESEEEEELIKRKISHEPWPQQGVTGATAMPRTKPNQDWNPCDHWVLLVWPFFCSPTDCHVWESNWISISILHSDSFFTWMSKCMKLLTYDYMICCLCWQVIESGARENICQVQELSHLQETSFREFCTCSSSHSSFSCPFLQL